MNKTANCANEFQDDLVNDHIMDSLVGRHITGWSNGDDGLHFHLDDGKICIISGRFWLAVVGVNGDSIH